MITSTQCPTCSHPLQPEAQRCIGCGTVLAVCLSCRGLLVAVDRFCGTCGTPQPTGEAEASPWDDVLDRLRKATAGDFVIAGELGAGGMAAVYRGHEVGLNRKVAIKVMSPGLLRGAGMVERFRQEAMTVAALKHPNIIIIHGVRQAQGLHFFWMPLIDGRPLDALIQGSGPLPIPVVQAVVYQVGSALTYAHKRGIVHRDVKPANVLLDLDGDAIVTDFGIAKVLEQPSQTATGATIGTPAYMSPEQCWAREVTGASDQYSLGIVAYEMLTGTPPFSGSTLSIMRQHTDDPVPSIPERRPDCPPEVLAALTRMLEKDPAARFPTTLDAVMAFGGRPLLDEDPVRSQIVTLVQERRASAGLGAATPQSPIPATRPATPIVPSPSTGATSAERRDALPTVVPSRVVAGLALEPEEATVSVGDVLRLRATAVDQLGDALPLPPVTWHCGDDTIATIDGSGAVTGLAIGRVEISAETSRGIRASLTVTVTPAAATQIFLQPKRSELRVGERVQFSAVQRDANEAIVSGSRTAWASSDPQVAAISTSGQLAALRPGRVIISATSADGPSVATEIVVRPVPPARVAVLGPEHVVVGGRASYTATAFGQDDAPLAGRELRWSVDASNLASIGPDGALVARSAGTVRVTATTEEGVAGSLEVVLDPVPVARVTLERVPPSVVVGDRAPLAAKVLAADETPLRDRAVAWRTSDASIATISASGELVAVAAGAVTISATCETQRAEARITVEALAATALQIVTPPRARVGAPLRLIATVRDQRGQVMSAATVRWSTSDPRIASIDAATGALSALTTGRVTISATSGLATAQVPFEITAPMRLPRFAWMAPALVVLAGAAWLAVGQLRGRTVERGALGADSATTATATPVPAAITFAPLPTRIVTGDTFTVTADVGDAAGAPLPGAPVAWRASPSGVVKVSPDGHVVAVAPGSATLQARSGAVSASIAVTVASPERVPDVPPERATTVPPGPVVLSSPRRVKDSVVSRTTPTSGTDAGTTPSIPAPAPPRERPPEPTVSAAGAGAVSALAAGGNQACAISADRRLYCWGDGRAAALVSDDIKLTHAALGGNFACALTEAGKAWCWGGNNKGQLGDGSSKGRLAPALVTADLTFAELTAGEAHACAITTGGNIYCWGNNSAGQLGDGSKNGRSRPTQIRETQPWKQVVAGSAHSCGTTTGGKAFCWGDGFSGALGQGMQQNELEPAPVAGGLTFKQLTAGAHHTCGIASDGHAWCWGENRSGQLGYGGKEDANKPVAVAGAQVFKAISAGARHTCGVTESGKLLCWGADNAGQLGDGRLESRSEPVATLGEQGFIDVEAGVNHTCAITKAHRVTCWGAADRGQLGDASGAPRSTPGPVVVGLDRP